MVDLVASPKGQSDSYARIEKAIHYITHHFKDQPSLEDIAVAVNLSPFHLQRLFSQWAGVSPKEIFPIYHNHARKILAEKTCICFRNCLRNWLIRAKPTA